jgi:hypothetical protein
MSDYFGATEGPSNPFDVIVNVTDGAGITAMRGEQKVNLRRGLEAIGSSTSPRKGGPDGAELLERVANFVSIPSGGVDMSMSTQIQTAQAGLMGAIAKIPVSENPDQSIAAITGLLEKREAEFRGVLERFSADRYNVPPFPARLEAVLNPSPPVEKPVENLNTPQRVEKKSQSAPELRDNKQSSLTSRRAQDDHGDARRRHRGPLSAALQSLGRVFRRGGGEGLRRSASTSQIAEGKGGTTPPSTAASDHEKKKRTVLGDSKDQIKRD